MWVLARELFGVVVDVGAEVGGGGPDVAVFEVHGFADLAAPPL